MTDKIRVTCSRCRSGFRERISRVRDGFQSHCPNCGCFINFSDESPDPNISRVMREVRRIRNSIVSAGSRDALDGENGTRRQS
jgi:hypothetical protein